MTKLSFKNCRLINAENYKSLGEIHLKQMEISATLGFGKEYKTAEHFLEQSGDGDIDQGEVELWNVVATNDPTKLLYECWVYHADTANVFYMGTTKDTNAAMCQFSFDDHSKDGSLEELCSDLQEAFNDR